MAERGQEARWSFPAARACEGTVARAGRVHRRGLADATLLAIRDMERAGIDIISDGEIRRESYSNRFATALDGVDVDQPAVITDRYGNQTQVPRVVGPIRRVRPIELRDMQFLRRNTDRP